MDKAIVLKYSWSPDSNMNILLKTVHFATHLKHEVFERCSRQVGEFADHQCLGGVSRVGLGYMHHDLTNTQS